MRVAWFDPGPLEAPAAVQSGTPRGGPKLRTRTRVHVSLAGQARGCARSDLARRNRRALAYSCSTAPQIDVLCDGQAGFPQVATVKPSSSRHPKPLKLCNPRPRPATDTPCPSAVGGLHKLWTAHRKPAADVCTGARSTWAWRTERGGALDGPTRGLLAASPQLSRRCGATESCFRAENDASIVYDLERGSTGNGVPGGEPDV